MSSKSEKKPQKYDAIKQALSKYNKKYSLKEFDGIVMDIHKSIGETIDYKRVRKTICKFSDIVKDKVKFNSNGDSEYDYKSVRSQLKKSSDSESSDEDSKDNEIVVIPAKKSKGFGMIKATELESETKKDVSKPAVKKGGFGIMKINDDLIEKHNTKVVDKNKKEYVYPLSDNFSRTLHTDDRSEPKGTQWIHDVQKDDNVKHNIIKQRQEVFNKLASAEYPPQRSPAWFKQRDGAITASDAGCVVGENHNEDPYRFIMKKLGKVPFVSNEFCHHGKKYEAIATMLYEYRMNVKVHEFGLIMHPKYKFLAASPDGIVGLYKHDGIHLTKHCGRMLEIKCPFRRKIKTEGEIKGEIVPDYYWVQVQNQLECCELDECDFWQNELAEYQDREEFIDDTDADEPFRSARTGHEKGCVIQMLPMHMYKEFTTEERDENGNVIGTLVDIKKYYAILYDHAKYIYPPCVEMTPFDCDKWISEAIQTIYSDHHGYCFDRVLYWKLVKPGCVTVQRDVEWFNKHLPIYQKMWDYVEFFRRHKEKGELLCSYIETLPLRMRNKNDHVMGIVETLYNIPSETDKKALSAYAKKIVALQEKIDDFNNSD
jgi:putative phage-type endonuclease